VPVAGDEAMTKQFAAMSIGCCGAKIKKKNFEPGLPDFSWYNVPKR
jgi:hypothetical protein